MFQQTCPTLHRVCPCAVVNSRRPECQCHPLNLIGFIFQRDSRSQYLFVNSPMMHFANLCGQLRIVVSACRVVRLNAQWARWHRDASALAFPLSGLAPRCLNWPLVSHSAPLNARYKEKPERAGSIAFNVRPAVTSSTPTIFFPCHRERASRFPCK